MTPPDWLETTAFRGQEGPMRALLHLRWRICFRHSDLP
jgi:hypothetical protein